MASSASDSDTTDTTDEWIVLDHDGEYLEKIPHEDCVKEHSECPDTSSNLGSANGISDVRTASLEFEEDGNPPPNDEAPPVEDDLVVHDHAQDFVDQIEDVSDLSSGIKDELPADVDMTPAVRHYIHNKNTNLNTLLNIYVLLAVTAAIALGLGNFLGWSTCGSLKEGVLQKRELMLEQLQSKLSDCISHLNASNLLSPYSASTKNSKLVEEIEFQRKDIQKHIAFPEEKNLRHFIHDSLTAAASGLSHSFRKVDENVQISVLSHILNSENIKLNTGLINAKDGIRYLTDPDEGKGKAVEFITHTPVESHIPGFHLYSVKTPTSDLNSIHRKETFSIAKMFFDGQAKEQKATIYEHDGVKSSEEEKTAEFIIPTPVESHIRSSHSRPVKTPTADLNSETYKAALSSANIFIDNWVEFLLNMNTKLNAHDDFVDSHFGDVATVLGLSHFKVAFPQRKKMESTKIYDSGSPLFPDIVHDLKIIEVPDLGFESTEANHVFAHSEKKHSPRVSILGSGNNNNNHVASVMYSVYNVLPLHQMPNGKVQSIKRDLYNTRFLFRGMIKDLHEKLEDMRDLTSSPLFARYSRHGQGMVKKLIKAFSNFVDRLLKHSDTFLRKNIRKDFGRGKLVDQILTDAQKLNCTWQDVKSKWYRMIQCEQNADPGCRKRKLNSDSSCKKKSESCAQKRSAEEDRGKEQKLKYNGRVTKHKQSAEEYRAKQQTQSKHDRVTNCKKKPAIGKNEKDERFGKKLNEMMKKAFYNQNPKEYQENFGAAILRENKNLKNEKDEHIDKKFNEMIEMAFGNLNPKEYGDNFKATLRKTKNLKNEKDEHFRKKYNEKIKRAFGNPNLEEYREIFKATLRKTENLKNEKEHFDKKLEEAFYSPNFKKYPEKFKMTIRKAKE